MKILIVEADPRFGAQLFDALREDTLALDWVTHPEQVLEAVHGDYALVIIDLRSGQSTQQRLQQLCRLRDVTRHAKVVALTDRRSELTTLQDCVDSIELLPCTAANLRRRVLDLLDSTAASPPSVQHIGHLSIDLRLHTVRRDGVPLDLTPKEFSLLRILTRHRGQVVSRHALLDQAFGWDEQIASNALEVHISNLRKKLGRGAIQTARGEGYRLVG